MYKWLHYNPGVGKLREGYRVVGPNTADGEINRWFFHTLEEAERFTAFISKEVDAEYDIFQYIKSVKKT